MMGKGNSGAKENLYEHFVVLWFFFMFVRNILYNYASIRGM